MKTARRNFLAIITLIVPLTLLGCGNSDETLPEADEPADATPRVVSLAPAITQMIVDMGQEKSLVGVGASDDAAPKNVPVVATYPDVNTEALIRVKPTHVLMMVGKDGAPARLVEIAKQNDIQIVLYPYPKSISDVANILYAEEAVDAKAPGADEPAVWSLGIVLQDAPAAKKIKYTMLPQLAGIAKATASAPKPRVLLVTYNAPLTASGPGTVLDELLHIAGGENAADETKVPSPTYVRESLLKAAPDVILYFMPGAPEFGPIDSDPRLAEIKGLDIPAVKNNTVKLISDPAAMLPSSQLARVAAAMAKAIHPDRSDAIDEAMKAPTIPATLPSEDAHETTQPSDAGKAGQ